MDEIVELTEEIMVELAIDYHESGKRFHIWAQGGAILENGNFVPEEVLLSNGDTIQWFAGSIS